MKLSASMMGLGLLLALASCQSPEFDNKDFADMNAVPLKPVCVGRLLIKVPERSNINWTASFDWAEVSRLKERNEAAFWTLVEQRKRQLGAQKHETESSLLTLFKQNDEHSAMLLHRKDPSNTSSYYLERYVWVVDRGYLLEGLGEGDEIKAKLDDYASVSRSFVPHDAMEKPEVGGFCIDGATITGDIGQIEAGLTVDLPQWKHTSLSIGTFELLPPAEEPTSAFQDLKDQQEGYSNAVLRSPEVRQEPLYAKEFDILRKRERSVGGFAGQEAVWRKTLVNGAQLYQFIWQSQEPHGTPSQPGLVIELRAGLERKPEDPPPPEEDLLALWDAVLESPKVR